MTVGLLGHEGTMLRKTLLPTIDYLVVLGILGWVAVYLLDAPDPLSSGPGPAFSSRLLAP